MLKYPFHYSLYILLAAGLLLNACNGQVNTASTPKLSNEVRASPTIVETVDTVVAPIDPYNDPTLVSQYIRTIFQDSRGTYWFGPAFQSVASYDGEELKYYSKNEFFHGNQAVTTEYGNSVHAIAEDQRGDLWFGTEYGVVRYKGKTFKSYTEKSGLTSLEIGRGSILSDRSGNLWVGTLNGVFRYIPSADMLGGQCFKRFNLLPRIKVRDIMEDQAGNIWFASKEQGVFRYDGETITNLNGIEGLGDAYAGSMAQDEAGNYWFITKNGICQYDGETFTHYTAKDGLGGSEFWGLHLEKSGIIWITARGSTTRFDPALPVSDPKRFTVFTPEDGLNCCVQSMHQDQSGNMWWGTGQGLYRFDGESFYQVKKDGPW